MRTLLALGLMLSWAAAQLATAQSTFPLPSPLAVNDVVKIARDHRSEIVAARARVRAATARPAIVSALEDPMLIPSIDHLPYSLDGFDRSLTVEQRFPLSPIRKHRREGAEAELDRSRAEVSRTTLDIELEALTAFFMLYERRQSAAVVEQQLALSRQIVAAANARYAGGTGTQSEVLRAEVDVARLLASVNALTMEIRAAEAMLDTSLGRDADSAIPPLAIKAEALPIPDWQEVKPKLSQRPELSAGRADINRAGSEVQIMRDMYKPMLTVRAGTAYTMTEKNGAMLMLGISLPIWRGRLRAGVAEAEAMREMAKSDLDAMQRMIEGEAARALNQVTAADVRHRAVRDDVVPRAQYAIEPALASYAAGRLPLVSVLEAAQTLWAARMELIQSEAELGMAWSRLGRAIGTQEGVVP